ncbi:double zinc ribbon domain-containing protein [Haloquadratum walsbyi]|jgi:hypothetical protein|uniref:DZR domain protein n=1 Tax=Haloquadratum walsbyi (strain DSM 16854 / JCM 12705 / C23) TaxID=768065 RepID=G0LK09_HALWC|nr:zinc ribbon domain-containing protein [Haloquadratum walsbyi]CCC39435.1 DZR domain protein [Haloquadratum walsbyi C23]
MSKITFRADDDLVGQLEEFEGSKSEVMREALRTYLENTGAMHEGGNGSLNNDLNSDTTHHATGNKNHAGESASRKVTVNIVLDDESGIVYANKQEDAVATATGEPDTAIDAEVNRKTSSSEEISECNKCGKALIDGHVYCPNCGEKAAHRVFCECGDEIQSDWAFCPSCGRRTSAADVLKKSS